MPCFDKGLQPDAWLLELMNQRAEEENRATDEDLTQSFKELGAEDEYKFGDKDLERRMVTWMKHYYECIKRVKCE